MSFMTSSTFKSGLSFFFFLMAYCIWWIFPPTIPPQFEMHKYAFPVLCDVLWIFLVSVTNYSYFTLEANQTKPSSVKYKSYVMDMNIRNIENIPYHKPQKNIWYHKLNKVFEENNSVPILLCVSHDSALFCFSETK